MTLAAVAGCSRGITRIVGVGNQRVKECNRIAAMVQVLVACGLRAHELPTGICVEGALTSLQHAQVNGGRYRAFGMTCYTSRDLCGRRCIPALLHATTTIDLLWQQLYWAALYPVSQLTTGTASQTRIQRWQPVVFVRVRVCVRSCVDIVTCACTHPPFLLPLTFPPPPPLSLSLSLSLSY